MVLGTEAFCGQGAGPLADAKAEAMLAEIAGSSGEVFARTLAIDEVVDRLAVALAGHPGGAILQQLHVAGEHHLDGSVNAAVALGEHLFGFDHNVGDRLPEGVAPGRIGEVPTGHVVPGKTDLVGRMGRVWYDWASHWRVSSEDARLIRASRVLVAPDWLVVRDSPCGYPLELFNFFTAKSKRLLLLSFRLRM